MPEMRPSARYFAELCVKSYAHHTWRNRETDVEVLFDRAPWGITFTWTGTESARDAIRDLRFAPWYDKRVGWCHAGFLKGVQSIWPCLAFSLRQAQLAGTPVYQNGHSLGGAEAAIAGGFMLAEGYPLAGLFTMGAPRPGSPRLRRMFDAAGTPRRRFVGSGDPVPELPPKFGFYDHPCDGTLLAHEADLALDHPAARYLSLIPEYMPAFAS